MGSGTKPKGLGNHKQKIRLQIRASILRIGLMLERTSRLCRNKWSDQFPCSYSTRHGSLERRRLLHASKREETVKSVLLARAWHLVCEMLYKVVKRHAQDLLCLAYEQKEKQACTHDMNCKRGMHFRTPPSQPRQGVATYFLLQVQPVRVTTHLP